MIYIILVVLVIGYIFFKASSERNEWLDKYGAIPEFLRETITDLENAFPQHNIQKQTSQDFVMLCKQNNHQWILSFSWIPIGLAIRIEYRDNLGRKIIRNLDVQPHNYSKIIVTNIMTNILTDL